MRSRARQHKQHYRRAVIALLLASCCGSAVNAQRAGQDQERAARMHLPDKSDLARLVDLAAQRKGLSVEYDERALSNISVLLRLREGVSDDDLWNLANRLLTTHGFTSVQPPGSELISVVKLNEATDLQRLQRDGAIQNIAGYTSLVQGVRHRPAEEIAVAIKPILSKTGGSVTRLGTTDLLLVSDVTPRVQQALELIERIDAPGEPVAIERLPVEHVNATQLAALVTSAVEVRKQVEPRALRGKVSPTPDGGSLVIVAPQQELASWKDIVARLDQREAVVQRTYAPRAFPAAEVAALIEQVVRTKDPSRGSGERWAVVVNELTGTLIVTATPTEHERVVALVAELDAAPMEMRRPLRAFTIRNRSVRDVLDVLRELVDTGALAAELLEPGESPSPRSAIDGTRREVLPSGTEPVLRMPPDTGGDARRKEQSGDSARIRRAGRGEPLPLTLTADRDTNTLIAIGEARLLAQLEKIIERLDVRQPQVLLEVLVISLNEGDTLDLGVELQKLEISGNTLIRLSSLFGLGSPTLGAGGGGLPSTAGRGFTGVVLNPGDFTVLVRALETLNQGRAVTMPWVLVNNNQHGTLDAVVEEPFISTNASDTVATTSFGGTTPAGTQVTVTPQIGKGDHLVLEYAVSLSSFVGEASTPGIPPPRQQNSIQSVVTIPDGYTVAVGGLEVINEADAVSQVPWISDIPILGEAFKNRSRSNSRSRLYAFIRANIMRHAEFEDLKFRSDREISTAEVETDWPEVEPRIIR